MKKEDKQEIVQTLANQIREYGNFYITDTADLTVAKINGIRRRCFQRGIAIRVAKNTLLKKAMEAAGGDFSELYEVLKGPTTIMFSSNSNAPAKLIKELRKQDEKPILKAAYLEAGVFIGDHQLDTLVNLKSKEELIGDIINLLQSPAKNVLSALSASKLTVAGLLKTLGNREEK